MLGKELSLFPPLHGLDVVVFFVFLVPMILSFMSIWVYDLSHVIHPVNNYFLQNKAPIPMKLIISCGTQNK